MVFKEISAADILRFLPERPLDSHKGQCGKIMLLCGSRGYTGAAALSAMGAMRTGAGLVYLCVPESIYTITAVKLSEPVVLPLPDKEGKLSTEAVPTIESMLSRMDAVLIGPGLGVSEGTTAVLTTVLKNFQGPVVVDADGINALSAHIDILRGRTCPTILTPHWGEFMRLNGRTDLEKADAAAELAQRLSSIVLLKGHNTVITDAYTCYVNPTGNPGMAVGGSGDVLSGIIVSLLGQGLPPLEATACAAWLHGKAGDICATEIGQYGMLPSDMLSALPRLLK